MQHSHENTVWLTVLLEACGEVDLDLTSASEGDTTGFQLLMFIGHEAQRLGKNVRLVAHKRLAEKIKPLLVEAQVSHDWIEFRHGV